MDTHATLVSKGWPDATARKAADLLEELLEECGYDCVDNFRFARASNPDEVAEYEDLAASGCCGTLDRTVNFDGDDILVGLNYGH